MVLGISQSFGDTLPALVFTWMFGILTYSPAYSSWSHLPNTLESYFLTEKETGQTLHLNPQSIAVGVCILHMHNFKSVSKPEGENKQISFVEVLY